MKKIYIIIIFSLFLLSIAVLLFFSKEEQKSINVNIEAERDSYVYSRINFFLNSPDKASLAIPAYWEGNYRIKETKNEVTFFFFFCVDKMKKLFSIHKFNNIEAVNKEKLILLEEKNNLVYFCEKANLGEDLGTVYKKMFEDIDFLLNNFKL